MSARGGRARKARPVLHQRRTTLLHAGWVVLGCAAVLCVIGLHCIELARGGAAGGQGTGLAATTMRQAAFGGLGLLAALAVSLPHYRVLIPLGWLILAGVVGLLVFVLVPVVPDSLVTPRNGARRWINLGPVDFQPSELAKIAYVIATAAYLRYRSNYRTLAGLIPPGIIAFVPMGLILVEPDLGTALLFIPALVAMLVAAGARLAHLIGAASLGLVFAAGVIAVSLVFAQRGEYPVLRAYQVDRIRAVVDRARGEQGHDEGRGFQGLQAMTLIGAGGVDGHPTARSAALVKYSSLPEGHNDMIFAVVVNRFGMVGAAGVIGLYLAMFGASMLVAAACKDPFGRLLVVGLASMTFTQVVINIGMNVGLLPITGMTLPFVSYGGSSLVAGFIGVGLICSVAMRRPPYLWRHSFEYDPRDDDEG